MAGSNVAIIDVNDQAGARTASAVASKGVESAFFHCDVCDRSQVTQVMDQVARRFGRLDIAVNNVGFGITPGGAESLEQSSWDRVLDVNLTGMFLCAQAQSQQMIRQNPKGGKIINMASIYAIVANGNCAYNAAKAGVIQLTRTLAAEWGRFNINVNCISPSWTMTPGMIDTTPELRARMREVTPMGHVQRPEDIYGAVMYLASRASDFVTGHNLIVDGGHTVNTWLMPLERAVAPRIGPQEELLHAQGDLQIASGSDAAEES